MSSFRPAHVYKPVGDLYTRIDNIVQFHSNGDQAVEQQLLEVFNTVDNLSAVTEASHTQGQQWPLRYHLSVQRANLLRPFVEYFPRKIILEVGSDTGSLTHFLAESQAEVVALESNFKRAELTAQRCRDLSGVTVINDSFSNFDSNDLFDIIIVAGGFNEGDAKDLLQKANSLLKEDGLLLLALDNKLGLKHWAGLPESFLSVGYGKAELQSLLQQTGFTHNEFYFPFPDYKFPNVILKEKALAVPDLNVADLLLSNLDYVQQNWYPPGFSLERAIRQVISNGLTADLANSFLVLAQKQEQAVTDEHTLAWLYSAQRKTPYRKENIFKLQENNSLLVEKKRMYPGEAAPAQMPIQQNVHNEPYLQGDIYFLQFIDIISTTGWSVNQLVDWAFPYYKLLLSLSQKQGNEWYLNGNYVDLTPFNTLIDKKGHLHVFDQEWQVNERVSLSFVLFRGLYYTLAKPLAYYPAQPGTPLFAYELIQKIISAFYNAPDNIVQEFIEQEQEWFSAISLFDDRVPQNFRLNIAAANTTSNAMIGNGVTLAPLQTIRTRVYLQTPTVDFSEQLAFKQFNELGAGSHLFEMQIDHPLADIRKLRLDLAEQAGLLQFHSVSIKNEKGQIVLHWDGSPQQEEVTLNNVLLINQANSKAKKCLLLSNEPTIIFTLPDALQHSASSSCTLVLELAAIDQVEESPDMQQVINSVVADATTPLETQIAATSQELSLLEEQVAEKDKEIALLQKTAQQYNIVAEENSRLQQNVDWYVRTYEARSLAGVVKTKFKRRFKRMYQGALNRTIETDFIQRKYAAAYLLRYARDNGPWGFCKAIGRAIKEHGLGSITKTKQLVLAKLHQESSRPLFITVPQKEETLDKGKLQKEIAGWEWLPKISIIIPVYNTKPSLLKAAIESVKEQVYENWELCIADDASTNAATKAMLASFENDPRIRIQYLEKNGGISKASNKAMEASTGEFIALFDHDDALTADALYWVVKEIHAHTDVDIIYSDECKVDEEGNLSDYFRKPDWSPELLLNMMYTGHLTVYKKEFLLSEVGAFRSAYDFSQDYDLMLRASEKTTNIRHIPRVLYHWRITAGSASQGDKPFARQTNLAALADAMQRRGIDAEVTALPTANRVKLQPQYDTLVSLIIPTDSYNNLKAALESIAANTSYPNYEVVVVTNSGLMKTMLNEFDDNRIRYAPYDKPYNFSDKCNVGADYADGEIVIFFNDDVRPLQLDWIENTIEYLWLPGVGGVSPKLVYENDTMQFAGMATGLRNLTGTTFHCYPKDATQYFNFPQSVRNISVLSGACLAMRKSVFNQVGGYDPVNTPSAHSDVDLSFKILDLGLRCVYTPYAVLCHIGHLSLADHEKKEVKKDKADIFLLRHWVRYLGNDPYFTKPMRELLYHDSPEPYQLFTPTIERKFGNKGDMLLVCHDLSMSGAPIMLFNICKLLLLNGYFVVLFCPTDGPLRKQYQQIGVTVIIDSLVFQEHESFFRFAKNFDGIICNTVVSWPIVKQMQNTVKTIWWLQEAQLIRYFLDTNSEFVKTLRQAKNVITVSDYSISYIKDYNPHYTKIYNACADFVGALDNSRIDSTPKDTLIFSIVGSIESRKGQDIVIEALNYLDEDVREKVEIHVVGRTLDEQYREMLNTKIKHMGQVRFLGEMTHEDSISYLYGSDVILSASRDDPFPVVLVEAMCMGKACIVSDATGVAELIEDGKNGFVFESENARMLAKKITQIVRNMQAVGRIGAEARTTYEKYLTLPNFEKRLLSYLNNIPETANKTRKPENRLTTISEG